MSMGKIERIIDADMVVGYLHRSLEKHRRRADVYAEHPVH